MTSIFETDRLIVRPYTYTEDDKEAFYLLNSDETVMRFIRPAKTREECDVYFSEIMNAVLAEGFGRWAVIEKLTKEIIGTFVIVPVEKSGKIQLGYALLPLFWGKGYATELAKAGVEYAFTKTLLNVLYAYTEKSHTASQQVLTKSGFEFLSEKQEEQKTLVEWVIYRNAKI